MIWFVAGVVVGAYLDRKFGNTIAIWIAKHF